MTQALSSDSIDRLKSDGILFPIPVFSEEEIAEYRAKLENLARREGGKLSRATNQKPHLLLPWLNRMIRDPRILGPVSAALGPNILCWGSGFFWKQPKDPAFISWHQDFDLLGPVGSRHRDGLGGVHPQHGGERLHAGRARQPP